MIELPVVEVPRRAEAAADVSAEAGAFLRLMADPTRRRIFLALMQGETCNCEMVGLLELPQNLISHHLRQLRQAGLVHGVAAGVDRRWIYYAVDREALRRVHQEIGLLFGPDRIGERDPNCGPALKGCD
jgi:ArsR family transcriptional regulator, arsenate/arsenite/antimonite-responsive transcriptional repressor